MCGSAKLIISAEKRLLCFGDVAVSGLFQCSFRLWNLCADFAVKPVVEVFPRS